MPAAPKSLEEPLGTGRPPVRVDPEVNEAHHRKWTPARIVIWSIIGILCGLGWWFVAIQRGETVNGIWFVFAAVCSYLIAYRFYSRFVENVLMKPDDLRATPAEYKNNGKDFTPTDRRITFGHHFAAIAGAGPLVGPILAAQMGYLPGTIWIIFGVIFAGAVQDYVVLFISMRRGGRSLGQMAKDQLGKVGGIAALLATLSIMLIIVAILALVVVNALTHSPWGVFSVGMTIPIALFMGVYMRYLRPGKVMETSLIGIVLLLAAIIGGGYVADSSAAHFFDYSGSTIAWAIIIYGFVAAVLPVWLLLAPRDYLSTFMKVGVIVMLAVAIVVVRPVITTPAFTELAFNNTKAPVFAGELFPFLFVTIACGALSGFHATIASGTTPKLVEKESQTRLIGYGGMLMESFVAIMALVAAISIDQGIYFAMNSSPAATGKTIEGAVQYVNQLGLAGVHVTPEILAQTAKDVGEQTIVSRTGGAPTLAIGLAHIMQSMFGGKALMGFWYHFAIMFEALFILTAVDAGTRVARFMLEDALGNFIPKFRDPQWQLGTWIATAVMVLGWGSILIMGVTDPLGGINTLFPLFGIANQLLAAVALSIALAVMAHMGRRQALWILVVPLAFTSVITIYGSLLKIFSPVPGVGYWAQHQAYVKARAEGRFLGTAKSPEAMDAVIRNTTIQTGLSALFLVLSVIVIIAGVISAVRVLRGGPVHDTEDPYIDSKIFAPSGLVPTPEERELEKEWAAYYADHPDEYALRIGRAH